MVKSSVKDPNFIYSGFRGDWPAAPASKLLKPVTTLAAAKKAVVAAPTFQAQGSFFEEVENG